MSEQESKTATRIKDQWWLPLVMAVCLLVSTCFVFGPIEFFWTNRQDIWFGLPVLLPSLALLAVVSAGVLLLIGCFIPGKRWVSVGVFVLGLLLYFQGNFLNADYGELQGDAIAWELYRGYSVVNTVIWAVVIVSAFLLCWIRPNWVRSAVIYISCGIMAVQLITLGTLFLTDRDGTSKNGTFFCSTEGMFQFGDQENIIVILADRFDMEYMDRIMDTTPEELAAFDGFEYYRDYAGGYTKTQSAVPFLLSGEWYYNDYPFSQWVQKTYGDNALFRELSQEDYKVFFYPGQAGASTRENAKYVENIVENAIVPDSLAGLTVDFYKLLGFRYAPHLLKQYLEGDGTQLGKHRTTRASDATIYDYGNSNFRDALLDAKWEVIPGKTFHFLHFQGPHSPYNFTADWKSVENNTIGVESQMMGAIRLVEAYLQGLKELGIYDQSTILFTADHGNQLDASARPLMMIKEKGGHGEITLNSKPTSPEQFCATVRELAGIQKRETDHSIFEESPYINSPRHYYYSSTGAGETLPNMDVYEIYPGPAYRWSGTLLSGGKGFEPGEKPEPYPLGNRLTSGELFSYAQANMSEDKWAFNYDTYFSFPLDRQPTKNLTVEFYIERAKPGLEMEFYSGETLLGTAVGEQTVYSFEAPVGCVQDARLDIRIHIKNLPFEAKSGDARRLTYHLSGCKISEGTRLDALLAELDPVPLDQVLSMNGEQPNATDFFTGLHTAETGYRWTTEAPVFQGKLTELPEEDLICRLMVETVFQSQQRVTISSKGKELYSGCLTGAEEISFSVPRECFADSVLTLEFALPDASSPAKLGTGGDERTLGIAISSIVFTAAEDGEPLIEEVQEPLAEFLPNEVISVNEETKPLEDFLSGIHTSETLYKWATGAVEFKGKLAEIPETDLVCQMGIAAIFNDQQRLTVTWKEKELYSGSLTYPGVISFSVPAECFADGTLLLDMELPDAASPAQLGLGGDQRTLSIAISGIAFLENG